MITEFQKKKKPKTGNDSWKPYHRVFEKSFKRKLTAKLDRVFSKYIRLRDTDENGYFTCPTCGKVKPFEKADCSHLLEQKTFVNEVGRGKLYGRM